MTEELPGGRSRKAAHSLAAVLDDPETVTLEDALRLLSLPRVVGTAPDGEEVLARNGRYGPYIEKGKETRSLESEEQIFELGLDEALALLAAPKQRRGRGTPRRRCASWATTPRPGVQLSSRKADLVHT